MRCRSTCAVGLGLLLLWALPSHVAARPRTVTANRLQLAGTLSYTFPVSNRVLRDLDPWGLGLGARIGYTFELGLYIGALADFDEGDYRYYGADGLSFDGRRFGGMVGLDLWVGRRAVVRPSLSFGYHAIHIEDTNDYYFYRAPGLFDDDTRPALDLLADRLDRTEGLFLGPGVELLIFVADALFLGLEGRVHGIAGDGCRFYNVMAAVSVGLAL